jgi:hypothetical protein
MAAILEELMAETVAERLRAEETRARTLDALEAHPPSLPRDLALMAAPALVDVAAETVDRDEFDRSTLLLARLAAEAAPDTSAVCGAGWGGGRLGAFLAPRLIVEATQRGLGANGADGGGLTREDAYSVACWASWDAPSSVRGTTALYAAAGHTTMEWIGTVSTSSPPAEHVLRFAHSAGSALPWGLVGRGAVDERRSDWVEEAYAVRRRAAGATCFAGSAAALARAARAGDRWRVEKGRTQPHRPAGACTYGVGAGSV